MSVQRPFRRKGLEDEKAAHTQQIVGKLREADGLVSGGASMADAIQSPEMSEAIRRIRRATVHRATVMLSRLSCL